MSAELFGRIVSDDQVEDAVMATLKKWVGTELAVIEDQRGLQRGYHQRPVEWQVRNDFDKWPEEALPMVIVLSTGLADEPLKEGGGRYRVPWAIGVACVVSSTDQASSRRFAYRMGAAIRAALVHNQSLDKALDGTIRGVTWLDGRNNELPQPEPGGRTIWATRQVFQVDVGDVLTANAGPSQPWPPDAVVPVEPAPAPEDPADVPDPMTVPDRDHVQTTTSLTREEL